MTTLREAAQMALDYLDAPSSKVWAAGTQYKIIQAIRVALAQPEQRMGNCLLTGVCAAEGHRIQKAQREWVGLTDEEIDEAHETTMSFYGFARAIETKLKEKNT